MGFKSPLNAPPFGEHFRSKSKFGDRNHDHHPWWTPKTTRFVSSSQDFSCWWDSPRQVTNSWSLQFAPDNRPGPKRIFIFQPTLPVDLKGKISTTDLTWEPFSCGTPNLGVHSLKLLDLFVRKFQQDSKSGTFGQFFPKGHWNTHSFGDQTLHMYGNFRGDFHLVADSALFGLVIYHQNRRRSFFHFFTFAVSTWRQRFMPCVVGLLVMQDQLTGNGIFTRENWPKSSRTSHLIHYIEIWWFLQAKMHIEVHLRVFPGRFSLD